MSETTWELFRWDDLAGDEGGWNVTGGTHESDSPYSFGYNAASEIGKIHGAGTYLGLSRESNRFTEIQIAERAEFFRVEIEDEPDRSLQAVPSAAEIMDREG